MPKIKFTAKTIQNLKPKSKSTEYFDSARQRGSGMLGLRVSPRGKRTWFLMYTVKSKVKRWTLGVYPELSLADARKQADKTMIGIRAGKDPVEARKEHSESMSFSDLWDVYTASRTFRQKAESSRVEEERKYNRLLRDTIGPLKVQDITYNDHIFPILDDLAAVAPVNSNRLFALLSVIFKFALSVKDAHVVVNPLTGRDKPGGREKPRQRYLSEEEIKVLWESLETINPQICAIFRLILLTAQRPSEVMGMEKREIDLENKKWRIPEQRTKTNTENIVPLSNQAIAIIEPFMECEGKYLFPSKGKLGHIQHTGKVRTRLISKIGMEHWTAHDLRRTARTHLSRIGVYPDISERILNHAMGKMKGVYDHYSFLPEKREALVRWGNEVERIIRSI